MSGKKLSQWTEVEPLPYDLFLAKPQPRFSNRARRCKSVRVKKHIPSIFHIIKAITIAHDRPSSRKLSPFT